MIFSILPNDKAGVHNGIILQSQIVSHAGFTLGHRSRHALHHSRSGNTGHIKLRIVVRTRIGIKLRANQAFLESLLV